MENILNNYRMKQIICAILGVCSALLLTWAVCERGGLVAEAKVSETQKGLAEEVLRFHVLANSASEEDQDLKLQVRDAAIAYMKENLPEDLSVTETEDWMTAHLDKIILCAKDVIREEGYSYGVRAEITDSYFPDRQYGDLWFPKGYYRALRVVIGEGEGHNWWCVLYPNLCITEAASVAVSDEGKEELQNVLTEEEYETVTATSDFKIKCFFFERFFKERQ